VFCKQVAKNSDVVFVSVKPQYVHTVLTEARPVLKEDTLVISIAAGITVAQLLEAAGPTARVCRVMPNTPCLVGETAAAMCLGGKVRAVKHRQQKHTGHLLASGLMHLS
jgi:pyrroline-5-carboxylate reductase